MGTQYYGPGKSRGVANGPSGTAPPGLPAHAPVAHRPHGASLTGPPAASLIPAAPQRRMSQRPDSGQGRDTVHKGLCSPGTPCWECRQAVPGLDLAGSRPVPGLALRLDVEWTPAVGGCPRHSEPGWCVFHRATDLSTLQPSLLQVAV